MTTIKHTTQSEQLYYPVSDLDKGRPQAIPLVRPPPNSQPSQLKEDGNVLSQFQ